MKTIPNNLVVSFNSEKEAKLIQLIGYKYGYNWGTPSKNSSFLSDCLKYLPATSGINFEEPKFIYFSKLDFYQKEPKKYTIISFKEFIKTY